MANHGGSSSPDLHSVFVDTNLDTRLVIAVRNDDRISDFKVKLCEEHKNCFSEIGKIRVSAVKVKRRGQFYSLIESMRMGLAFHGVQTDWFLYVDLVVVKENEVLAVMDINQNCSDPDLLDEKKESGSDSILVNGHTKNLSLEEDVKTVVKKTKKRKLESSDGKRSRKKPSIDVNHSAVEVFASQSCSVPSREKSDDIIMGAICEDIESEKKNDISMEENHQTSEADKLCQEKILTVNSGLVDGHTRGEVKDVEGSQTLEKDLETDVAMRKSNVSNESPKSCGELPIEKLDDIKGAKQEKTAELVKIDQEKKIVPTFDTSRDDVNESYEKLDGLVSGTIEKDNGIGEGSRLTPSAASNLQSTDLMIYPENQLETNSNLTTGPATEEKKKKKKSSKDHINQSAAAVTTTSSHIVNVDPISRKETKENDMGEKSVKVVGGDKNETDNLAIHLANHLDTNSGLTNCPVTEKKKRKKSSKDHINQSAATATTTSSDIANTDTILRKETLGNPHVEAIQKENEMGEKSVKDLGTNSGLTISPVTEKTKKRKKSSKDHISQSSFVATSRETMNDINGVPENVDHVDAIPESFPISRRGKLGNPIAEDRQQGNETGEKMDVDMGSEKAIPTAADIVQTNNSVTDPENQLEASHVLTAGPATEKKRKHKKSSKDKITQSAAATPSSREIVDEREKVSGSIDRADVTSDSIPHCRAEKLADTLVDAIQTENEMNQQVAVFASTPVCEVGKLNEENRTGEYEVAKDNNGELDAGEAKSVKSSKKKNSRKSKTPAKEDTLVASGSQNVEPIVKAVDGEEPENVIRNVLDSLQQKNQTKENLNKTGKKSSKKSKKKTSLNNVEDQVLSVEVNNSAQKEVLLISNTKDTDASLFMPAKDNNPSKQIVKENADIGDNFGSSQKDTIIDGVKKQDQVTCETNSKKKKKSLDLHPGGSIDGSLISIKPKEKIGRVQPAGLVTSHLQSIVKYDRNGSKADRSVASKKVAVNNKKEAMKKGSNSVTVNKSMMSFFKDSEWDSTDDESNKKTAASDVSTKSPSDSSSGDDSNDSDLTSMSRKQGNNESGGTNRFSGSLQDILRSSKSFKMAKLRASQSLPDVCDDDLPTIDCVPDSQAN